MKYKSSIIALVSSFAGIALVILSVLIGLVCTDNLSKRTAGVVVPAEGGYVEVWSEHAPIIAHKLDIPAINLYTYENQEELYKYLSQAEKYNILWAEVIVSGEYNLEKLFSENNISTIDNTVSTLFPYALHQSIYSASNTREVKFIPLSYNPWIMVQKSSNRKTFPFKYAIGGSSDDTALSFLNYIRKNNNQNYTTDEAIQIIHQMSNDKTLIKNARTYTTRDAFIALENGTAEYCYMPVNFFNSLSISQRQELIIEPVSNCLICDATVAIFPVRKSDENKAKIEKAKEIILSSDMMYASANARGWLPALNSTVSRSSYTDSIKRQAKIATDCNIPALQFKTKEEQTKLVEGLNSALRTVHQD